MKDIKSKGASDLLIGGMAMHLSRIHGKAHFSLISNDRRMKAIFSKAAPNLNWNTAHSLGLISKCEELGFGPWCSDVYPQVIDLARCKDVVLQSFFGEWPMPTGKIRNRRPKA